MAKVTVSAYAALPVDINGHCVPIAGITPLYKGTFGTTAETPALPDSTRFVRIATDTAICVKRDGAGADGTSDLMPANTAEFFGAFEGVVVSWVAA